MTNTTVPVDTTIEYEIADDEIDVELELCETEAELNAYFKTKGIGENDFKNQIYILSKYMCIIGTGNFKYISEPAECMILRQMFINGEWRQLTDRYLRANLKQISDI
jgi:hypothetical protein